MSSSSSNAIQAFLAEFVTDPALSEKAHGALCDLFATLHAALALQFVHAYSGTTDVPSAQALVPASEPRVAPPAPAPPKKKASISLPMCTGLTAKKEPCPRRCCPDAPDTFCSTHLAQSLKEPKVKAPAPASKKAMRAQVPVCTGKTAKNEACTRKCCPESDIFCSTHLAQSLKPVKEKKPKAAKSAAEKKPKKASAQSASSQQKPIPTHNHALTEEVEAAVAANCDLCQSHGNAADPELTGVQFEEISGDLQSRLKSILANLHEIEDDDEEDEDDEAESALVKPDADQDEEDQAFGDAALLSEGEEEPEDEEEEFNEESDSEVDED
jgi:hypothetical protein